MQRIRNHLHLFDIFEVAARHGSFKSAAEELNLSPSAVSHQIKSLENQLGNSLFERKPGKVSLNHKGQNLYQQLQPVFEKFDNLKGSILTQNTCRIMVPLLFPKEAAEQLLALPKKQRQNTKLELQEILSLEQLKELDFDFSLRIGNGQWENFTAVELCRASTQLVAHKDLVEQNQLLEKFDPAEVTFLYGEDHMRFLRVFPQAVSLERDHPKHQYCPTFKELLSDLMASKGYSDLFVQIIKPYLDSGELIALSEKPRQWREKIYLIYQKDRELSELDKQIIKLFKQLFN